MKPTKIVVHCTATEKGQHITTETIRRWHTSPPRNWSDVGYHFIILNDGCGTVDHGRPVWIKGAHTKGHNDSIGIAYVGGMDNGVAADTMTEIQEASFFELVDALRMVFGDDLAIYGHNEFANKRCPSFDVIKKWGLTFTRRVER